MEASYITSSDQLKHPFSLTCQRCDAGAEIDTPEQAIAEGWREIEDISNLNFVEAYYIGLCPEHAADE